MPLLLLISRHVLFFRPCRKFVIRSSYLFLTYAPHLFVFAPHSILWISILQSTQHPVFECFFLFLSNVIFVAPMIPRWFIETHRHLSLCYCLVSLAPPSSFDGWASLAHISGSEHMCVFTSLCFLFSMSSLHITPHQSVWFFVRGNYWLPTQPFARCFSLSPPYHLICLIFAPYPLLSLFSSRLLCSLLYFSLLRALYATYFVSHALCSRSPLS